MARAVEIRALLREDDRSAFSCGQADLGLEHAASGVTVNAIGTNYMDLPGFLQATGANDPERRKKIESQVPMRRLGTMEELAAFAAVFLDGRSRYQTGQFFSFSGGWST